ncbi:MAG: DUF4870 domain-containing protein [Candidatus Eremiobacteraeota bacterium]|nr:DUF4870 domain-containing protein [Candidatus Eremiobacteraeota bacterium]
MQEVVSGEDRNQALFAHLSGLLAVTGMPFAHVVGPLVFYLMAKNKPSDFALENAREALNFQITAGIVYTVAIVGYIVGIVSAVFGAPTRAHTTEPAAAFFASFGLGFAFLLGGLAYGIFDLICIILAAIRVGDGETFRYPLSIRFVR